MPFIKGKSTYCAATSKYHVSDKNIIEVDYTLQYIQEEQDTTLL